MVTEILSAIWNKGLIQPIANLIVLLTIYTHNLGVSVMLTSLFTQLLFLPFTIKRYKTAQKLADLYPQLRKLQKKYKKNIKKLKKAQSQLYKTHGVKPATNWLLLLITIPIMIALYKVVFMLSQDQVQALTQLLYPAVQKLVETKGLILNYYLGNINLLEPPPLYLLIILAITYTLSVFSNYLLFNYLPKSIAIRELKEQLKRSNKHMKEAEITLLANTLYYTRYFQLFLGGLLPAFIMRQFPALLTVYLLSYSTVQLVINSVFYFLTKGGVKLPQNIA